MSNEHLLTEKNKMKISIYPSSECTPRKPGETKRIGNIVIKLMKKEGDLPREQGFQNSSERAFWNRAFDEQDTSPSPIWFPCYCNGFKVWDLACFSFSALVVSPFPQLWPEMPVIC